MDLKRLHYFCVIVEQGQISRAAKVLNMTQPPLSQRLKELETELDTQLIIRRPGVWELTEAGKALYKQAKSILSQVNSLQESVQGAVEGLCGEVTVGVSTATISYMEKIIPALYNSYPKLRFRLKVADSSALEQELHNKILDFALLLLPLEKKGVTVHPLPECHYSIVYPKTIPLLCSKEGLTLDDLAEYPLAVSRRWWGWGGYKDIMAVMRRRGHDPQVVLDSQNIQALVRIMQCGLNAVLIIPDKEVTDAMRDTFSVCPLNEEKLNIRPAIVYKNDRILSQAATTTLQTILEASQ